MSTLPSMRIRVGIGVLATFGACSAQYTVEVLHSPAISFPSSFAAGAGDGQQVGHNNLFMAGPSHASLWSGTAGSFVDLHPVGWDASYAVGVAGGRQVGWRERHTQPGAGQFATMWSGSASNWVDLHVTTYQETNALSIAGNEQVGFGVEFTIPFTKALMWQGTAASAVSLHPAGFQSSWAYSTDGQQQVGYARTGGAARFAASWTGSAGSYANLHPPGYEVSEANGVAQGQQVGFATINGNGHAMIWFGNATSFIDLNPGPNASWGSQAFATNGSIQVGLAASISIGGTKAAAWFGTPESYLNLHTFLPVEFQGVGGHSRALGVDEVGNIVGYASDLVSGTTKAILWKPVPEPLSFTVLLIGIGAHLLRRRETKNSLNLTITGLWFRDSFDRMKHGL